MRTILTARISTLIVGLVRGFFSSLRFAESSVCESCGLSISVRAGDGTSGSNLTIDCIPPNALPFSLSAEVTADGRLLILCGCSRSESTKSVRGSGVSGGTSYLAGSYANSDHEPIDCSRCKQHQATHAHSLRHSVNVRPKWPYLCNECYQLVAAGELTA